MDSRKRKEKLLNQVNKDKRSNKNSFNKKSSVMPSKIKVDAVPKKAKPSKPAFTNEEALKSRISKEKDAYKKATNPRNATGLSRTFIRLRNRWNAKSDQEKYKFIGAWVVVLLLFIVVVALLANGVKSNKSKGKDADKKAVATKTEDTKDKDSTEEDTTEAPANPLVICTNSSVEELITKYFTALRDNDLETLKSLDVYQESYKSGQSYKNIAGVIEDYTNITVYTKEGPYDKGYVAYVVTDVKFKGVEHTCQGMYRYVIVRDGDVYKIDTTPEDDIEDDDISIKLDEISMSYDVLDLYDRVNNQAQADIEEDEKLKEFITDKLKGDANITSAGSSGMSDASGNAE